MNLLKRIVHHTYRPWAIRQIKKDQVMRYRGLTIEVPTGVFHPGLFFSTKLLASFIQQQDLRGKSVLELGCGTGLLSCVAAREGARVLASDINPKAVACAAGNAERNEVKLQAVQSDLFQSISERFDIILINPPYYPKNPKGMAEHAWYAGEDLQYFERLFQTLPTHLNDGGLAWMVASEDVELQRIQIMAEKKGLNFTIVHRKWTVFEWNFIIEIRNSN